MEDDRKNALRREPQDPAEGTPLDSWKEIARYLSRSVRTVQRWERTEGLPVRRQEHDKLGSVFALRKEVDAWRDSRSVPPVPKPKKIKLLILPLKNLTGTLEQEYFSDGLTEELISQAGRIRPDHLGIIAYGTALHYKGSPRRLDEIAAELGVHYVLEGSVRRFEDRVRITARLIRATDQTQRWSDSYERPLTDILMLQSDVARKIAQEILFVLGERGKSRRTLPTGRVKRVNAHAYEKYLKARYCSHSLNPAEIAMSIGYFRESVGKDTRFALAYCGLADAYALLAMAPFDTLPPRKAMTKAEAAARKAIGLDGSLVEAHAALGLVLHHYCWDWAAAEQEYARALELNPNHAAAHVRYSWLLMAQGRHAEALEEIERAQEITQEIDPRRLVVIHATRALAYYYARQYERAVEQCRRGLDLDKDYFPLHFILARAAAASGELEIARQAFTKAERAYSKSPLILTAVGCTAAAAGQSARVREAFQNLKALAKKRHVPATYFGILAAAAGRRDEAFAWFEKAVEERADGLTWLKVDPAVDSLRSDPRFPSLLRKVGLAE